MAFYVDMRNFLNSQGVKEKIGVRVRQEDAVDEYGIQIPYSPDIQYIEGVVVEKLENGYDTTAGSFLERVVYKIYLDRKKYKELDLMSAELLVRDKVLIVTSMPLVRPYASHFIVNATERKVDMNVR